MLRSYKISPLSLIAVISCLMVGEIASGTSIYFVTMMAVAMLSIGLTYNLLGGLSTLSGMIFAMFALRTIVISQIAKVLLFEAADKNLEAPELTIYIYAMFYLSAFVGVLFLGKIRLRLPKPMEPTTIDQENIIYIM